MAPPLARDEPEPLPQRGPPQIEADRPRPRPARDHDTTGAGCCATRPDGSVGADVATATFPRDGGHRCRSLPDRTRRSRTLSTRSPRQIEQVLRGKKRAVHLALVCLFAEGHLLIEDVPGVGKTSLAKAIARSIGGSWRRIQFTPDLLPSDVTGASVWDRSRNDFDFRPGGVFANVVLADEINRASPKTQSALLEAMEERQVTVDAQTYRLPTPFMVIATQNPVELEGTYPLPEAQLDRFLLRLRIGYPDRDAELAILDVYGEGELERRRARSRCATPRRSRCGPRRSPRFTSRRELQGYVVDLVDATRHHRDLMLGVSPAARSRCSARARALAASVGRAYVVPDDIKSLAPSMLEHRLVLSPEAMMRGVSATDVLASVLDTIPVPANRQV